MNEYLVQFAQTSSPKKFVWAETVPTIIQGCISMGKTGNFGAYFPTEGKHREFTKKSKCVFTQGIYLHIQYLFCGVNTSAYELFLKLVFLICLI